LITKQNIRPVFFVTHHICQITKKNEIRNDVDFTAYTYSQSYYLLQVI